MEFFITNLYIVFSRVQAYLKDVCQSMLKTQHGKNIIYNIVNHS
ncbi:hypothetical protein T4E_807 [Trichinella pseudospiralis]|uniref:Uncharacterized protein n=1 Tax=Trichinella pseudospiralis TaxID=6337 RepID=A0A0V0XKF2_TRIPS|nr:hypothetical protein T4E_807 [Trichinella pseudospiralis]